MVKMVAAALVHGFPFRASRWQFTQLLLALWRLSGQSSTQVKAFPAARGYSPVPNGVERGKAEMV
jgi:hypothetical protein